MQRISMYDRISEARIREQQRLEEERLAQAIIDAIPVPERFHTNELSFIRPQGFKDKTFHVFTLTDIGASPLSVVIGRTPVEGDKELEYLSQLLIADLKKALSHLEWIEPLVPVEIAGVEGRRAEFRWRQQGTPVHQVQFIFLHHDEQQHPVLIQVTGTSNDPGGMNIEEKTAFYLLVDTLKLRLYPGLDQAADRA